MINDKKLKKIQVLPNFLVIGMMKSGTTWLYEILKSNPEVYLCDYVKEINYFNVHYEKGINWYKKFFPTTKDAKIYKAIGDVTATYMIIDDVPNRVFKNLPEAKFIVVLRNPVSRAFSHYKYNKLNDGFTYNFEEYMKINQGVFRYGLYCKLIKKWFEFFPRERFLILIFEEAIQKPLDAMKKISDFLNIDYKKFDTKLFTKKENPSYIPRLHKLFLLFFNIRQYLLAKELYILDNKLLRFKKFYSFLLLGKKRKEETLNPIVKKELFLKYKKEIEDLEKLLNLNLDIWKP